MKKRIDNQSALFVPEELRPAGEKLPNLIVTDSNELIRLAGPSEKIYIGIDNGVTGTITIMKPMGTCYFYPVPTKVEQSYTQKKQNITRIDAQKLFELLKYHTEGHPTRVLLEIPMVNPQRLFATFSALRCLEALLIIIELLQLPYSYMSSRKWQKELLPLGLETDQLKKASLDIGNRLFPQFRDHKHKDRDSLLMTEYARRNRL